MSSATLLTPVRPLPATRRPAGGPAQLSHPPADRWLAAAVAAAVGGPDRFAARTPNGTHKPAFVTAVINELVRLGDRVLLVAADADGWCRVLTDATRAAAQDEAVAEDVRHRTTTSRAAAALAEVEASVREAGEQLARWDVALPLYSRAADVVPIAASAPTPAAVTAAEEALPRLREQWKQVAPLAEAKRHGRVGSGAFWKAVFTGDVAARAIELEKQVHDAESAVQGGEAVAAFWSACDGLRAAGLPAPDEASPAAVAEAAGRGQAVRRAASDRLAAARAEREELSNGRFPADLLVASSITACIGRFDRVIVDADGLTDEACGAALDLTARAVLVGAFDRPGCAARAWTELPPPAWVVDAGRLVARLEELADIVTEPLADRPAVQVSLGVRTDGSAGVAGVSFPLGFEASAAVGLLADELGEVRLVPAGPDQWTDELQVVWPLADGPAAWVQLGDGVSVAVTSAGGRPLVSAARFDPASWDRSAAEAWVDRHISGPRAVCLGG